jgi:hypothetical protein
LVSSSVASVTPLASIPRIPFSNPLYVYYLTLIEEEEAPPMDLFFSKKKREIIKGRIQKNKIGQVNEPPTKQRIILDGFGQDDQQFAG